MNFYDYAEIRAAGNCRRYVTDVLGLPIQGDRCQARWRGGIGWNVALQPDEWYDHKTKQGGGLLELCAMTKFDGEITLAQDYLGKWLGLTAGIIKERDCKEIPTGRYVELLHLGYKEIKRYNYTDEAGKVIHTVVRLEHPEKGKEFLQRTPTHWGLGQTVPILYNLPGIAMAPFILVVEGEKDADTLIELGLPATTNCGGAEKWRPEYAEYFKGKKVAILRDNDDAGAKHAHLVSWHLREAAAEIRIVNTSEAPKGDVTDYIAEGHSKEDVLALIKAAPALDLANIETPDHEDADPAVAAAKLANRYPIRNFKIVKKMVGEEEKKVPEARQARELVDEIHTRFLGFPCKVGDQLFDHDRDTGRIEPIHKTSSLFAWMAMKSGQLVEWKRIDGAPTKEEIFEAVLSNTRRYEAISEVPDWPKRDDVYYAHPALPNPSPDHADFEKLVSFFRPINRPHEILLRALLCAPLYYMPGIPRPMWIIDSEAPGSGKTTLAETVAKLYGRGPVSATKRDLTQNYGDVVKRLVSSEGRQARVVLTDNVTGNFSCPELAAMQTSEAISGKAPYGRGEESRPNNLTYIITANNASIDNDLAIRAYFVKLLRIGSYSANWAGTLAGHLDRRRLHIIADIIDILTRHKPFADVQPVTRTPDFEQLILQAHCRDVGEYSAVVQEIGRCRGDANSEAETGGIIESAIRGGLVDVGIHPDKESVWINSRVLQAWLTQALPEYTRHGGLVQMARNVAQSGHCPQLKVDVRQYPANKKLRSSGVMWLNEAGDTAPRRMVTLDDGKAAVRIL